MKSNGEKSRLDWIDFLRGWAILFVAYAHFSHIPTFLAIVGGYEMPMFYALSGFLTNVRGGVKIKHLFLRIYIPLFTLHVTSCLYEVIRDSNYSDLPSILFHEMTSWFLPTFFFTTILFRLILVYFKGKSYAFISTMIMLIGFAISGFHWANDGDANNICIAAILMGQWFLMIGYAWKEYITTKKVGNVEIRNYRILSVILLILFLVLEFVVTPGRYIDVHLSQYPNFAISMGLIISSLLFGYSFGSGVVVKEKSISRFFIKPICYLGQNAIYIYLLHGFIKSFISVRILENFYPAVKYDYLNALIYTIITMVVCSIIIFVIDKFCPILLGKGNINKKFKCQNN